MDIPEARTPDPQGAASRTTTGSRRLNRRTPLSTGDAAQSNDGAGFFGLVGPPKVDTEEACPSCPACGWGLPIQTKAASRAKSPSTPLVSPTHGRRDDSSPLSPGGLPPDFDIAAVMRSPLNLWWGERHDRAHPRVPAQPTPGGPE